MFLPAFGCFSLDLENEQSSLRMYATMELSYLWLVQWEKFTCPNFDDVLHIEKSKTKKNYWHETHLNKIWPARVLCCHPLLPQKPDSVWNQDIAPGKSFVNPPPDKLNPIFSEKKLFHVQMLREHFMFVHWICLMWSNLEFWVIEIIFSGTKVV